ncbi:Gfo/Idh/MocA family protein [Halomicrobium salinisoli]|uniref:Gfo/Idh/MocA family protein n=1 Tax=Halomicrobium salinisoli TaxID=2878391 RepID=UPI001CF0C252|nr:Gfo/Idh/MocA family oxidoreductase [Halomicrobium salinisoli]
MTLDVGMLGYRFMGKAHSNALDRLPMFFPDAPETNRDVLVGRDEEALAEAADTLGFDRIATDWRDVVDEVDVFYNLAPNHVHPEPSVAALEAGTPVFCEKPLAPTLEAAEEMATAAADAAVPAGVAFNYRFVPALRYARNLIRAGELGEIYHFRGKYLQDWLVDPEAPWSWRNDEEMAGSGALGDLGAHTIDLARFLIGDAAGEVDRVSGHLRTFVEERPVDSGGGSLESDGADAAETRAVTVDDAYSALAEFENGAMGTFEASRFANGYKNDHAIEIEGSRGSLRFDLERLNELEVRLDGNRGFETILVTDADDPYVEHWWPPGHVLGWEHLFVHENYEFLSAIAEGSAYEPNFGDGVAVQRVLAAIERSDERGEWVSVE